LFVATYGAGRLMCCRPACCIPRGCTSHHAVCRILSCRPICLFPRGCTWPLPSHVHPLPCSFSPAHQNTTSVLCQQTPSFTPPPPPPPQPPSSQVCLSLHPASLQIALHTGQNWHYAIEIFDVGMMKIQSGGFGQHETHVDNCYKLIVRIPPLIFAIVVG
jgi:hypothetical protein